MKTVISVLLLPILVYAESVPVTRDLLNEPATQLDVGMVRLEMLTADFEKRVGLYWTEDDQVVPTRAAITPWYDKKNEKIHISFSFMTSVPSEPQMLEACENATVQMEHWLRGSLPGLFLPVASAESAKIPTMFQAFEGVIVLHCHFSSERNTAEGRFWAYRYLGNRDMTIGKWDARNQ